MIRLRPSVGAALSSLLAWSATCAPHLGAQMASLRFRSWGLDEGMTHDAVWALHQDRSGLLWVGTQDGLLRFDGERFESVRHDVEDPSSLSDDNVAAIYDDGEGGLWIGTYQGWLNRLDLTSGDIERIAPPPDGAATRGLESRRAVYEIVGLISGQLALATDVGPLIYDTQTRAYTTLDEGAPAETREATALSLDADGALWIGYSDGRLRRAPNAAVGGSGEVVTELGAEISAIRRDYDGALWVATRGQGVFSLGDDGEVRERFHASAEPARRLLHDRVQDIWLGADGELWVATISGLTVFSPLSPPAHFVENDIDAGSLPDRSCQVILRDEQGIIWIGTLSGLARVHPYNRAFVGFRARGPGQDGIAGGGALAIAGAGPSRVWVGTYGGGLDELDLASAEVVHHAADPLGRDGPAHGEVKSLAVGSEGSLWIATMGGGITRLDARTGRFERIPIVASTPSADASRVTSIFVDRQGAVWASTQFDGLHRYDPEQGVFRRYRGPDGTWDFGSDYAWPIIEDRAGNLWLGVFEGGLVRISPDRRFARLYNLANSALPSDLVITLHEGSDGYIWVGTEGAGLLRFDPRNETVTSYTTSDGLPHNNVEGILSDDLGNLWLSTNDGLARMDPAGAITSFSPNAGIHGRRFYANSAFSLPDGRLAFGGEQGLTVVAPERLRLVGEASPVVLTGFTVSGESRPVTPEESANRIELGPSDNFFAFRFTALDYADPESVEYRYRLDPLDDAWVENGNSRIANYTSVPPDEYVFRVSARNSFGVWSEDALTLGLVVHPPFHATLWFRSLVLAAVASLLTAAYTYRMQQLTRVHEVRFGIAGRLHDEIGANLSAIALKSERIRSSANLAESSRDELGTVGRIARETTAALRETIWMVSGTYDTVAGLITKLRDSTDLMLDGVVAYSVDFSENPPGHPIEMERRQGAYLLFKEALHNVVKHAHAEHVNVVVRYERPTLSVSIDDDGRGFDPATSESGNGIGLMRERAARHRGSFRLTTAPGRGTKVEFTLRLR